MMELRISYGRFPKHSEDPGELLVDDVSIADENVNLSEEGAKAVAGIIKAVVEELNKEAKRWTNVRLQVKSKVS